MSRQTLVLTIAGIILLSVLAVLGVLFHRPARPTALPGETAPSTFAALPETPLPRAKPILLEQLRIAPRLVPERIVRLPRIVKPTGPQPAEMETARRNLAATDPIEISLATEEIPADAHPGRDRLTPTAAPR